MYTKSSKTRVILIVAADKNRAIGDDNGKYPWHGKLKKDFKNFRELTTGHPVITGRVTYETLPIHKESGFPLLPNRQNIIVTSREEYEHHPDAITCHSIEEALEHASSICNTIYVIGGGEIYKQTLQFADEIIYTDVQTEIEKPVAFFPKIPHEMFYMKKAEPFTENGFVYGIQQWVRSEAA